jgi:hypothetical protein
MANLATNLPVLNVPLVDENNNLTVPWLMFLVQLYQRTGADQTPALTLTQVQASALINLIIATANGFAGTVNVAGNEATITLKTTVTGLVKGNGIALSTAISGTDYAPATVGSIILKGDGAGGFSNAISGTDYAPATSGSSILYGNGAGGFSNVTVSTGLNFASNILKIANTTVTAGMYGSPSQTFEFNVNAQGQLTGVLAVDIGILASQIIDQLDLATQVTGVLPTANGGTGTAGNYLVSTLPTPTLGKRAVVTDALAPVFLATVAGGGAVKCPVFADGTTWKVG